MQAGMDSRFESLLGRGCVLVESALVQRYAIDGVSPNLVVNPQDGEQVSAVLRVCDEEKWGVVPFGSGTQQDVGKSPEQVDVVLSTEKLNRIQAYDSGDLTISLEAGVPLAQAVAACAEHRQLLPFEAPGRATVGGALATSQSGPLRAGFGSPRDFCIGITFVTGDGIVGRGGGRVVKNVAGYDLMKLLIGSYGSLGVITSANFKLFPAPKQTTTLICDFNSLPEALALRDWLIKSPLSPIACEVINSVAVEFLRNSEPRDPDDWAPEKSNTPDKVNWRLAIRFAGSDHVLARVRKDLCSSSEVGGIEEVELWKQIGTYEEQVAARHKNAMIFHLEVPMAQSQSALEAADAAATNYNFVVAVIGRATIGSFVIGFLPLAIDPPSVTQYAGAASDFRSRLSKASSAIVVRCPREAKQHFDVWGSAPTDVDLMRKVKHALDPRGILNPGRFLVG